MRNVRVFTADLSDVLPPIYGPLLRAKGISGRAETRVTRRVREELRSVLTATVQLAFADGSPIRTGRARRTMLNGVRAFGQNFRNLRGYIIGPEYIAAHEEGATITPKNAKALAIPLEPALRPDGSPKLPGPRSWSNSLKTFIYKSKRTGNAYIAYKNSSGRLTLLYVLVDSVTLKKHSGFLSKAWETQKPDLIEAIGLALLFEFGQVDLLALARVTTSGRKSGGTGRRRRRR